MPSEYIPIFILMALAIGLAVLLLLISTYLPRLAGSSRPGQAKLVPYESGIRPVGSARRRVPIKFYLVAMLFLIFDIEVIFFFPWAASFGLLRITGMAEFLPYMLGAMLVFIAVLTVGFIYEWKKGALNWE
jgi:NADH-quinone oxidoreductase subunit A